MKISRLRMAVLTLSVVAACSLGGCVLVRPIDGWVIQNGNDRVHFSGYSQFGDRFYVEAWCWQHKRWERLQGEHYQMGAAVADGSRAWVSGEPPIYQSNSGGEPVYLWTDRFFVKPEQWVWNGGGDRPWRAAVRAINAETGKPVVHRMADGSGGSQNMVWIYCPTLQLRDRQRFWWEP
jgi:hypothetical protein